ncbi:MAG TPA: hypothetical protein VEU07_09070 [Candidatus Acidoferrum sp.]|nr:hypothetical protein [Candidatus Acidoferrum sp.]
MKEVEGLDHSLGAAAERAIAALDVERVRTEYWNQNECVYLEKFLPPSLVESVLIPEAERLRSEVHRAFIPGHKKSGSVGYFTLREMAPVFLQFYRAQAFIGFLSHLAGARLLPCPESDPHACALYFYTEPGDHMGFHYDTSYYKGSRYTILLGLIQRSENCQLVCQLFKDNQEREMRELRLSYGPGDLVIFNGNKLWHGVSPLEAGGERVVLTMEYVTNPEMAFHKRLFSNLKDAFAYFGPSAVFLRRRRP